MSIQNWPGGVISDEPVTPSGPYQDSTAPGVWTLDQVANYVEQGNWPTAGNTNPDAFIENLFQTWLYTGNDLSTQTITNGIDLAGEGGLVWIKARNTTWGHRLSDTSNGTGKFLDSSSTNALATGSIINAFNANGFTTGDSTTVNNSSYTYASWTFRKQPKFFDVVTYTGTGSARTVAHSLGSAPGCIIIKSLESSVCPWVVYHRSVGNTKIMRLNGTDAESSASNIYFNSTDPTSTDFTLGTYSCANSNGVGYVAYLFAHNAGGFGLTGTDNVISCGSYTGNGSSAGPTITLGYEPQWLLIKRTDSTSNWYIFDVMRGMPVGGTDQQLSPNLADAENPIGAILSPTATGFYLNTSFAPVNASGGTYIYIAIRRGPMKVPTTGTEVFSPQITTSGGKITTGFVVDTSISNSRSLNASYNSSFADRLRGNNDRLLSSSTGAEIYSSGMFGWDYNDGFFNDIGGSNQINYLLRRAPGFFDEVCYTGTGSATTLSHNLAAAPELMIGKSRSTTVGWPVYSATLGNAQQLVLNSNQAASSTTAAWNSTSPTTTQFSVGSSAGTNSSGVTYVMYLFASCPGVSKVGSYTGTGTTLQIDCGFTAGSRFVLIKRTDSTGDWYVWDSARGIVSGNDPYLLLNSTAAEVTNTDYVDTYSAGFEISSTAPSGINASGGSFIFLAIS